MSRLRELMEELCPNGVEYKKFYEHCSYIRGITYNKSNEAKGNDLQVWKVLRANNITLSTNMLNFDEVKLVERTVRVKAEQYLKKNDILICAGSGSKDHIGKVAYITEDMEYTFGGFMAVIRCDNFINSRYLFHVLTSTLFFSYLDKALNSSTINNLNSAVMKGFEIPVPPLEIQNEIVKLLDNFTELTAELTTELTTELTLRKKQYNFYRDSLLNFVRVDDTIVRTDRQTQRISKFGRRIQKDIVWRTLGDIGTVCMCKRILKQQTNTESGIPFYKIGTFGKTADSYISEELFAEYKAKYSYPRKGEILISAAGTIGRSVIYDGSPAYFQDSNIVWIANDESVVLNRYLYYFYSLFPWRVAEGGTVARLYNDQIRRTEIPVPPLEVQQKIVSILDRFDALCNDLTSGLPAEIAARKKQYEHYRDKLLTFPRSKLEERS